LKKLIVHRLPVSAQGAQFLFFRFLLFFDESVTIYPLVYLSILTPVFFFPSSFQVSQMISFYCGGCVLDMSPSSLLFGFPFSWGFF